MDHFARRARTGAREVSDTVIKLFPNAGCRHKEAATRPLWRLVAPLRHECDNPMQ